MSKGAIWAVVIVVIVAIGLIVWYTMQGSGYSTSSDLYPTSTSNQTPATTTPGVSASGSVNVGTGY